MKNIAALLCLTGATLLLSGCFPTKERADFPGTSSITVKQDANGRYVAVPPDCTSLLYPSQYDSWNDRRPAIAFGCATMTNLAGQVANPLDLVAPAQYPGQHADTADSAVTRYREGKVIEPKKSGSTKKIDSSY